MVLQLVLPRKRPISINAPLAARYLAPESITQSLRRIRAVVVPPELLPTIEGLAIAVGLAASENNVIKVRCASDGADVEVDTWFVQWGCWERPLIQVRIAQRSGVSGNRRSIRFWYAIAELVLQDEVIRSLECRPDAVACAVRGMMWAGATTNPSENTKRAIEFIPYMLLPFESTCRKRGTKG